MKFYQIGIEGRPPQGGLFDTRREAEREVNMLFADDRRDAAESLREAGIEQKPTTYQIHEVER